MAKVKAKKSSTPEVVKNNKRVKNTKVRTENEEIIRRFVIIFIIIVVIVVGVYFLTNILVNKDSSSSTSNETIAGEVNYDILSVGTLLNRPYKEYYVMVYNSEDSEAIYYSSLITNYEKEEDASKIYFCDLANALNSSYSAKGGESNPKAKSIEELKFGKVTLIKVKDGKISKYLEDIEAIKTALQ